MTNDSKEIEQDSHFRHINQALPLPLQHNLQRTGCRRASPSSDPPPLIAGRPSRDMGGRRRAPQRTPRGVEREMTAQDEKIVAALRNTLFGGGPERPTASISPELMAAYPNGIPDEVIQQQVTALTFFLGHYQVPRRAPAGMPVYTSSRFRVSFFALTVFGAYGICRDYTVRSYPQYDRSCFGYIQVAKGQAQYGQMPRGGPNMRQAMGQALFALEADDLKAKGAAPMPVSFLMQAAIDGDVGAMRDLYPSAGISPFSRCPQTHLRMLKAAVDHGHANVIEWLASPEMGTDINGLFLSDDHDDEGPLLHAYAASGVDRCVRTLLAAPGIDVNRTFPEDGTTPL